MDVAENRSSKPHLLVLGVIAMALGCALLVALGMALYSEPWSDILVSVGMPIGLLAELAGLAAFFGGAALIAASVAARRRGRR